jgi:hypothetical protein
MAGGGGRSNRWSGIERTACTSGSWVDVGRVGAQRGHLEVSPRGAIPAPGWQLADAVPDAVAHVAGRQSPVPQQRAAGAHCGGCRLPDRYGFQPCISARVRIAAGGLASQPLDSRARRLKIPRRRRAERPKGRRQVPTGGRPVTWIRSHAGGPPVQSAESVHILAVKVVKYICRRGARRAQK